MATLSLRKHNSCGGVSRLLAGDKGRTRGEEGWMESRVGVNGSCVTTTATENL